MSDQKAKKKRKNPSGRKIWFCFNRLVENERGELVIEWLEGDSSEIWKIAEDRNKKRWLGEK